MLNNLTKQKIKEAALKTPNEEICGLLIQNGDSPDFIQCKNVSSNKQEHFELSCFDYLNIAENHKIIGIIHSQTSNLPSSLDVINSLGHNLKSYIYSLDADDFIEVTEEHLKYKKYLGKIFKIGEQDCFTLIQNFYQQELNIIINNYPRKDGWFECNPKIIEQNYEREGFIKIDKENIQKNDIIEFSFAHFAIYLGNDLILHHKRSKLSNIERLDESYKSRISNIYRSLA